MKNILIFGASCGIGYQTAVLLNHLGYKIYNASRQSCPMKKIENITTDASISGNCKAAVENAFQSAGKLDGLIYCAGCSMASPAEHVQEKDYRYLFEVNFFGALEACRAAIPYLRDTGGKIVLVSSLAGITPIPYDAYYSASKAALNMLAQCLSLELQDKGVSVTAFMPGGTATDFTFKRKIYPIEDIGDYSKPYEHAVNSLKKIEQGGSMPSEVAEELAKIFVKDSTNVIVTAGLKNKLIAFAAKILPYKLMAWFCRRMYKIGS